MVSDDYYICPASTLVTLVPRTPPCAPRAPHLPTYSCQAQLRRRVLILADVCMLWGFAGVKEGRLKVHEIIAPGSFTQGP